MDEYILLADGTRIEQAHVLGLDSNSIIVYVRGGIGIEQMYQWFHDPDRTGTIKAYHGTEETLLTGYTELFALRVENANMSTACLRRGQ